MANSIPKMTLKAKRRLRVFLVINLMIVKRAASQDKISPVLTKVAQISQAVKLVAIS